MCELPCRRIFSLRSCRNGQKAFQPTHRGGDFREDKNVDSAGFNGFVTGADDGPEIYAKKREVRTHHPLRGECLDPQEDRTGAYCLYTRPFMSCIRCAVVMLQAGIKNFVAPYSLGGILISWFLQRLPLSSIVNY